MNILLQWNREDSKDEENGMWYSDSNHVIKTHVTRVYSSYSDVFQPVSWYLIFSHPSE